MTREDVLAAIRRDFAKDRWEQVLSALNAYGAGDPERERVQLAILKLCAGEEHKLQEYVRVAKQDYRDILLWADHPAEARIDTAEKKEEIRDGLRKLGLEE